MRRTLLTLTVLALAGLAARAAPAKQRFEDVRVRFKALHQPLLGSTEKTACPTTLVDRHTCLLRLSAQPPCDPRR